jgi:hypothetical protein
MNTNPTDSAFPEVFTDVKYAKNSQGDNVPICEVYSSGGISKQEYFAAMALQGLLANPFLLKMYFDDLPPSKSISALALQHADTLIAELNKRK